MSELLLSYYGDDLTGSTDVMEALASRGVPNVLFLGRPTDVQMRRFAHVRAMGLAGTSRSEAPDWMDEHLAPALDWLKSLRADICHYKVCSTFDSSPHVGSIGRAIDVGARVFAQAQVPLVVGAPQLQRYTAFGNLFAAYQGQNYRIDRHPVMSRHPVTPMHEADLRLHLRGQTARQTGLVDLAALHAPDIEQRLKAVLAESGIVLFDVADGPTQALVGRLVWAMRQAGGMEAGGMFVAGSSGVEYALLAEWRRLGLVDGFADFASPGAVARIAVVSGSCSPTTARQIRHAEANGFAGIALDPRELASGTAAPLERAIAKGLSVLESGKSVILYTALGPESDLGAAIELGSGSRHAIGRGLGQIERALIERAGLKRGVIAGGDTSSHALVQLDIHALTTCLPLPATPGSPLCTAFSDTAAFDGLQIALKGGQVGADDYFSAIRAGKA